MIDTGVVYIIKFIKLMDCKNGQRASQLTVKCAESEGVVTVWGVGYRVGDLVTFSKIKNNNGMLSCSPTECVTRACPKDHPFLEYLPKVVTRSEWDALKKACIELVGIGDSAFISDVFDKLWGPYSTHTAARSNHHAYAGGLAQHTYEIVRMFVAIYPSLPFKVDPFVVILSGLFHDYGKLSEYTDDLEATPAMSLQGHPFLGAEAIGAALRKAGYGPHVVQHCQHCVLAHHGRLEFGSPVRPATTEAFLVSKLDELSGHGVMFDTATPGGVRGMDTTMYRY